MELNLKKLVHDLSVQTKIWFFLHVFSLSIEAQVFYETTYGEGTLPFVMDNVRCTGSESALTECDYLGAAEIRSCSVSEDAGIRCQPCKFALHVCMYMRLSWVFFCQVKTYPWFGWYYGMCLYTYVICIYIYIIYIYIYTFHTYAMLPHLAILR